MWKIIVGILVAGSLLFGGRKLFAKRKILDKPGNDQKVKRKPVPTILGVFVFLAFFVFIALAYPQLLETRIFRGLVAGSSIIIVFSFLDELHYIGKIKLNIPIWIRIFSHILGAVVAVLVGGLEMPELLIGNHTILVPQRAFMLFFIARSFLCINAINRFDYGNGQASGISAIGFASIFLLIQFVTLKFYVDISPEHQNLLEIVKILCGSLFVLSAISAIIERKPIGLIRDVGTMFFGFALAYLSVVGGTKIGTLVIALSLVIFDAIRVGMHRFFFLKKSPVKGDFNHIHHRLSGLGWTKGEIRMFVWVWSVVMMILILLQGADRINKLIIFLLMALIFFGVNAYLFRVKKIPCGLEGKKEN